MPAIQSLVGRTFGRLFVFADGEPYITPKGKRSGRSWCQCSCGNTPTLVHNGSLKGGLSKGCGHCSHETHGHAKRGGISRTFVSWASMIQRCTNLNHAQFKDWGGRGIIVCERWMTFENFLTDMGECPPRLTIDRWPDKNGNYEPGNCRWATRKQQQRNMRSNVIFTIEGITACMSELAERFGLSRHTVKGRLRLGWTPEKAFTTPVNGKK